MMLPTLAAAALSGLALGVVPAVPVQQHTAQDSAFIAAAGYGGNFEVAGGELAQARAVSPAVRAFGARMVSDHNRAGAQLAAIVRRSGASLPDGPDSAQQQIITNWARLNGQAFDCSYVPAEYLDHVGAVGAFQAEADHGSDADLVAFARQTLPALQEHERMISAALTALDCGPQ